ncbi:FmdE family protein [Spirochaetota bacterium]
MNYNKLMKKAVAFHGHSCPGVALGVMAAGYILDQGNQFSIDEELVAIVENDNCSVDALQALLGTTFGKGNFKFLDYGKNAYTFYNRKTGMALRLSLKDDKLWSKDISREERTKIILKSNPEDIFDIQEVEMEVPESARVHDSIVCANCGELAMSTRIQNWNGKKLCTPCYEALGN